MTPEALGHELAALLRPPADPGDPDELRADFGIVTRILNAERRLALVEMAGGVEVAVPYGTGRPVVGHRYPVYSTPQGDRWIKVAGEPSWCQTWTATDPNPNLLCGEEITGATGYFPSPGIDAWGQERAGDPGDSYGVYMDTTNGVTTFKDLIFEIVDADGPTGEIHFEISTSSGFSPDPEEWAITPGLEDVVLTASGERRWAREAGLMRTYVRGRVTAFAGFGGRVEVRIYQKPDFAACGYETAGILKIPPAKDRLELVIYEDFGSGKDGAGVIPSGAHTNLQTTSISGRSAPDGYATQAAAWITFSVTDEDGDLVPAGGLMVGGSFDVLSGIEAGDEFIVWIKDGTSSCPDAIVDQYVGRWETHRVWDFIDGVIFYKDYVLEMPAAGADVLNIWVQRVPNYTTLTKPGVVDPYGLVNFASGMVAVRCSVSANGKYNVDGGGAAGGIGTHQYCFDADTPYNYGQPGNGKRWWSHDNDGPFGPKGGGDAGQHGDWITCGMDEPDTVHFNFFLSATGEGHHSDTGTPGGGGGHANDGAPGGSPAIHSRRGIFDHHTIDRNPGGGGDHQGHGPGPIPITVAEDASVLAVTSFCGWANIGGGGGTGGRYLEVDATWHYPGNGGAGGGFIFVAAPVVGPVGGDTALLPTGSANGTGGGALAGGGAGGSIVVIGNEVGGHWNAAEVSLFGVDLGRSGAGGPAISNNWHTMPAGGAGSSGRVHIRRATENHLATKGVARVEGLFGRTGCWASPIFSSGAVTGESDGVPIRPTTLTMTWTLDSDALPPTIYLIGGNEADLSDGVIYPMDPPQVWQDGGTFDIDNGVELDLSPYALAPAPYWRVWACLDIGGETTDTPTIPDITLCGEVQ